MVHRPFALMRVAIFAAILISLIVLNLSGCKRSRTPNEKLTVERIAPYCTWLEDYKRSTFCYPDSWADLLRWKGVGMPENPYTGQPMVALDSSKFDRKTSPGNIYYIRVVQEDCVINCQVIIFGDKGEITRYSHAGPLSAK